MEKSSKEDDKRRDEVLRRMLQTPPQPRKVERPTPKKAEKRKRAAPDVREKSGP